MDPELARIRREAYLSHKRQREEATEPSEGKESPAGSELEVIDVDDESLVDRKKVPSSSTASWACERCTFVNDCKRGSCEMCDHPNHAAAALESDDDSVQNV